jgi:thymidylate synthase
MQLISSNVGELWWKSVFYLRNQGQLVEPRGIQVRELTGVQLTLANPYANILLSSIRKPAYRFMVAEWLWIWFGRQDVATIAQYNSKIAQFSDDGKKFYGAYGPRIKRQWANVIAQLRKDPDTRQAVISIFDGLAKTKDVPCTMTVQFLLRDGKLKTIVNMRSSDVWLGLPYDIFNFTMLANIAASELGVRLGTFQMNLGSSHLYATNFDAADEIIAASKAVGFLSSPQLKAGMPYGWLEQVLVNNAFSCALPSCQSTCCDYARALTAPTNREALEHLKRIAGVQI